MAKGARKRTIYLDIGVVGFRVVFDDSPIPCSVELISKFPVGITHKVHAYLTVKDLIPGHLQAM